MQPSFPRVPWPMAGALALGGILAFAAQQPEPVPTSAAAIPVGVILAFGGPTGAVPEAAGWLLCDGRELRAEDHPQLAAALGRAWGGEGGRFRLPDLRGRFLRGVNLGATSGDPDAAARLAAAPGGNVGNEVGTVQEDALGPHTHAVLGAARATGGGIEGTAQALRFFAQTGPDPEAPLVANGEAIAANPGTETRPRNAAVNWIIKAR
ncbi:MAG: phage tail protein [Limisphaerales bacterium]